MLYFNFCSFRAEEMLVMVGEVSEKVDFIQDSLSELDSQLGQLQDLSALAVDTLSLISASDSRHQEEARLTQCQHATASQHILPHSWTLPNRSDILNVRQGMAKLCKSTPPSLLEVYSMVGSRRPSQECHIGAGGGRGGSQGHTEEGQEGAQGVLNSDLLTLSFYNNNSFA